MKRYAWLTGTVVAMSLSIGQAAEPNTRPDSVQSPASITAADSLDIIMEQWYQFILEGNDSQANAVEQQILRLLSTDVDQTQKRLTSLISSDKGESKAADATFAKADTNASSLHDSVEFLRSSVRVKRILYESISASDAFSYKYRLLGDYVDLLRREVGLPKLKLASEKNTIEAQKN